jgi:hypothetical protein
MRKRFFMPGCVLLVAIATCAAAQQAEPSSKDELYRQRKEAFELYDAQKFVQAMPLLEKLAARLPKDVPVQEAYGFAMYAASGSIKDPEKQKAERARAHQVLMRAKELGDNSNLLLVTLDALSADGALPPPFSQNKEVHEAMEQGESAFTRGDLQKAIDSYMHAYLLDPSLYSAPLFIGDSYYKMHKHGAAEQWYSVATNIDPNAETAWRYWGDALASEGHDDRAVAKYIEAVIAEPFVRKSWVGLLQWAERNKSKLSYTRMEPADEEARKQAASYWAEYDRVRAEWRSSLFLKNHPQEKTYRRSLDEEAAALRALEAVAMADYKSGKVKSLPKEIVAIHYLNSAGVLEPAILFTANDGDIARDYGRYREVHRDLLRYYLASFIVPLENGRESLAASWTKRPSLPEERAKVLDIAKRSERDPISKVAKDDRGWMVAWISETPDFMLIVCSESLTPLLLSKKEDQTAIWFSGFAGSAAFVVEHPESMRDINAVNMAGVQSALRAYQSVVAKNPNFKIAGMDELLAKSIDGRLTEEMLRAAAECSQGTAQKIDLNKEEKKK